MRQTADISTAKLFIVLARAYRSLTEFLEGGLVLESIQTTDFAILEALRHEEDIKAVMGILTPEERSQLRQALKKIGLHGERLQHARSMNRRGGLAPWQLRRATEYMTEHVAGRVPLKELAGQAGLSPSRFGRAFKLSMGISPHRWQTKLRSWRRRSC